MTKVQSYTGEYLDETLEDLLEELTTSITTQYPDAQVILFGSYARDDYTKDSDLDICVLVPQINGRRLDISVDISCIVREEFPLPFDLLLYTYDEFEEHSKSKSRLQYKIKNEGLVLNGRYEARQKMA